MTLLIENPGIEQLAKKAAALSGTDVNQAILHALENYLMKAAHECIAPSNRNPRYPDNIQNDNEHGLPLSNCMAGTDAPVRGHGPLHNKQRRLAQVMAIVEHCAAMPDLDTRSPDDILGYNEHGLFD